MYQYHRHTDYNHGEYSFHRVLIHRRRHLFLLVESEPLNLHLFYHSHFHFRIHIFAFIFAFSFFRTHRHQTHKLFFCFCFPLLPSFILIDRYEFHISLFHFYFFISLDVFHYEILIITTCSSSTCTTVPTSC